MNDWELEFLASPETHAELLADRDDNLEVASLRNSDGNRFPLVDGIPDFRSPGSLPDKAKVVQDFYDGRSETYDQYLHLTFHTHNEDELQVRNGFVDLLGLSADSSVLEVAAGSGRDSTIISQRLRENGTLCVQDISAGMLSKAREKLQDNACRVSFALGDATKLPYKDRVFDSVFSFGGLGEFPDIRAALKEMVRVCKIGGRIVVGDESIPVWWRDTEFAKILTTTNPQFNAGVPFAELPVDARNVHVRWVIGGVFYLIDFCVGDGPPAGNFDYPIPGHRGGTLRSRYLGQLEGVTPETKELAHKARIKRGISMHDWLEEAVKNAAETDLKN